MVSKKYPKQVASRVKFDSQIQLQFKRELLLHRSFLKPQIGKKKISFWYNSQLGVLPLCNADLLKNIIFISSQLKSLSVFQFFIPVIIVMDCHRIN
jgi:hypothetical protein